MSWFSNLLGDPQTDGIRTPRNTIQDYNAIKQQCLTAGQLFEDPIFSPRASKRSDCVWLRPFEISRSPKFVSEGISRFDVVQGELGDCWLVAAVANLTLNSRLFNLVIPAEQNFDRGTYCGLFRFRFYQFGKWVEVVIDDKLPCRDGKLLFMSSTDPDEFWSPLLEKAYAKLHGSYDALRGGTTCEAMVDMTGGLTEFFDLQTAETPPNLYSIVKKAFERGSLLGCSIEAQDESQRENELPNGLVKGHAYSITSVLELDVSGRRVPMVRLRNPWSGTKEWNGPWSDKSREWSMIGDYERQKIGLTFDADGEFWMAFHDFQRNFTRVELCNLTPDELDGDQVQKHWHQQLFEGSWVRGQTAGGCRNNLQTFAMNPQYVITLVDPDEDDNDDLCTMIVALMQKNKRSAKRYQMGSSDLTIGFAVYALREGVYQPDPVGASSPHYGQQLLTTDFFKYNCSIARSPTYINLREITSRFKLPPGTYAIIPSTFDKGEEGEFILRVWTESPAKSGAPPSVYPDVPQPTPTPMPAPSPRPQPPPPLPTDDDTKKPAYPPYPAYPTYPSYPPQPVPAGGGDLPSYPTIPDEPSIIRRKVPPPPPGPSIDISIGEVIGTVSSIISLLSMCWNTYQRMTSGSSRQTYPASMSTGTNQPSYPPYQPSGQSSGGANSSPFGNLGNFGNLGDLGNQLGSLFGNQQQPVRSSGGYPSLFSERPPPPEGGIRETRQTTKTETNADGSRRIVTTTTTTTLRSVSSGNTRK